MRVFLNNLKEKYSKKSNDRNDYVYLIKRFIVLKFNLSE